MLVAEIHNVRRTLIKSAMITISVKRIIVLGNYYLSNDFLNYLLRLEFVPMDNPTSVVFTLEIGVSALVFSFESTSNILNRKLGDRVVQ